MKRSAYELALATALLAASADAQDVDSAARSASPPASWSALRFDLAQLTPNVPVEGSRAAVGQDVPVTSRLVAGVEAEDWTHGGLTPASGISPLYQREVSLSGRLGVVMGTRSLVYGRVGYGELDVGDALSPAGSRARSLSGLLVGAGSEIRLSPALSLRTEYQVVDYAADLSNKRVLSGLALRF